MRSHIVAGIGTVVALLLLLLLLFYVTIRVPAPVEDEGILVTFGDAEDDGGSTPGVIPFDDIVQMEQVPAPAISSHSSDNDLMVQEEDESLILNQQNESEQRDQTEQAELLRKQQEAEAQAEAERIAREKALAEKRAKQEEAIRKAQEAVAMMGLMGSTDGVNADEANVSGVSSTKPNKDFGQEDGPKCMLDGRKPKFLPKPSNDFKEEGKVVVSIRVDKAGNVVAASVGGGTTITDRYTQQLALDAARKTKFTEGNNEQIGSITYNFKLN
ncbi:MAG: energy transducer TonB [Paludibacteraceae bacterium]|nr:energy transducer TonB [Paludibacteraceae bacterium]